jgi:phenylacetate-CoA ligase
LATARAASRTYRLRQQRFGTAVVPTLVRLRAIATQNLTSSLKRPIASGTRRVLAAAPDAAIEPIARVAGATHRRRRRTVREWRSFLTASETWSGEQLDAYALSELRKLLEHAHTHVPHYRALFRDIGFEPNDVRELTDLRALPTLSKRELQDRQPELLATNLRPRDRVYATTTGSTGTPVGFFQDRDTAAKEWAFIVTQWSRIGYRDGDRTAILRGSIGRSGRLFERAPLQNALIMSSYHLTEERLPLYLARLREFRPRFLQAYPSSAALVARYMLDDGQQPIDGLRGVLCGSEPLYAWQRQQIEEAFGCRAFSWYGQSERVCLAAECEHDTRLHLFPQYGVTELVDERGAPIDEPGRRGEIVATGFLNDAMPLIRYRTGDVAVFGAGTCPACGRAYPLFDEVEGRMQEFLVGRSGRYLFSVTASVHSRVFDNVRRFRFRQSVPGKVTLLLEPKPTYVAAYDEPGIRSELAPKFGSDVDLLIQVVETMPLNAGGKFKFIEQELPGPFDVPDDASASALASSAYSTTPPTPSCPPDRAPPRRDPAA